MLESTFIHCTGVGPKTEKKLWDAGFKTWDDLLLNPKSSPLSVATTNSCIEILKVSTDKLAESDYAWFAANLEPKQDRKSVV